MLRFMGSQRVRHNWVTELISNKKLQGYLQRGKKTLLEHKKNLSIKTQKWQKKGIINTDNYVQVLKAKKEYNENRNGQCKKGTSRDKNIIAKINILLDSINNMLDLH